MGSRLPRGAAPFALYPGKAKVDQEFPLSSDAQYAVDKLFPDLTEMWRQWSKEYRDPRELGVKAEFVEIHRKTKKLKLALWDGVDTSDWRETPRQILFELASHAFLAIKSLDDEEAERNRPKGTTVGTLIKDDKGRFFRWDVRDWQQVCSPACNERHTYRIGCTQHGDEPNPGF